jgi:phage gp37-like protein
VLQPWRGSRKDVAKFLKGRDAMPRVMCVCNQAEAAALKTAFGVESADVDLMCCDRDDCVVDEVVTEHPDVLIYELRPESDADLAVLWLVHHVAPRLPVVLMGEERSAALPQRMAGQPHRTALAAEEIREAVHEALLMRASV